MPDFDKWPLLIQWIAGLGVFVGGIVMAIFGTRVAGNRPSEDGNRGRDERERAERSKRYTVERELETERLERRFEKIIDALRVSILGELEKQQIWWREEFKAINARISAVERGGDATHPRRPRQ